MSSATTSTRATLERALARRAPRDGEHGARRAAARRLSRSGIAAEGSPTSATRPSTRRSARCCSPPPSAASCALAFPEEDVDAVLERLAREALAAHRRGARRRSIRCGASSTSTSPGAAASSTLPLDWTLDRRRSDGACCDVTAAIPYGGVLTYAEVAAEAGSPRGSRAAGNALGSNPIPIVVPCHRVLRSGGALGGYGGGLERKRSCSSSRARSRRARRRLDRRRLDGGAAPTAPRPDRPRACPRAWAPRACRAGTTRRRAPPGSRSRRR